MAEMKYKYIAFDMDGTLINTLPVVLRTMQQALQECTGRSYAIEDLHFAMGLSNRDTFEQLGIEDYGPCVDRWEKFQKEAEGESEVFPQVPDVLHELKRRGCILGIVTSREKREYEAIQNAIKEIEPFFDYVVLSDMTEKNKPAPEPMMKFIELCKGTLPETLYIGDAYCDMQCAASAGVHGALALWGALNKKVKADYYLKEPQDILDI